MQSLLISLYVRKLVSSFSVTQGEKEGKKYRKSNKKEKRRHVSGWPLAACHIIMNTLRQRAGKLELNRSDRAPAVVRVSLRVTDVADAPQFQEQETRQNEMKRKGSSPQRSTRSYLDSQKRNPPPAHPTNAPSSQRTYVSCFVSQSNQKHI